MENRRDTNKARDIIKAVATICFVYGLFHYIGIGCPIKFLTGISCAGCGMTRAYIAVFHLDLKSAVYFHPLFWIPPIYLLYYVFIKCHLEATIQRIAIER